MNSSTNGGFDGTTDVCKWGGIDSYIFLYFLISSLAGMHIHDHRLDGFMINASWFYCHF